MVQVRATKNGNKEELQEKREQVTTIKYFYKEDIHWYKLPLQKKRQLIRSTINLNKQPLHKPISSSNYIICLQVTTL